MSTETMLGILISAIIAIVVLIIALFFAVKAIRSLLKLIVGTWIKGNFGKRQ